MKNRNRIAAGLTVILGIVTVLYFTRGGSSPDGLDLAIGTEPFDSLPAANVKRIIIQADPADSLTLHQVDGEWRIQQRGDYPADKSMVDGFILNFQNMKVLRSFSATPNQLPTLNLLPPTNPTTDSEAGVRVELQDASGKRIHSALLGKESSGPPPAIPRQVPTTDRRFLMIDDDPKAIIVVDQTFSNADTDPKAWLNKDFFQIEEPANIAVTFPGNSTNSWRIAAHDNNGTTEWKLADHNASIPLDTAQLPTNPFSSPSFEDVADPAQARALDTNATRIDVATRDNFHYSIRIKSLGNDADGASQGYLLKMEVTANFPAQRVPDPNESAADKAQLDANWAKDQAELKKRLAEQKKFTTRVYQVPAHIVNNTVKNRAELIAPSQPPAFNPNPGFPPGPLPPLRNFPPNSPPPDNLE